MKQVKLVVSAVAMFASGAALADMRYSNFEVSLIDVELDGAANVDGDGFSIAGSYEMNDHLFLLGEWQDQSFDFGIDGRQIELGAGLKHELKKDLDFVGTLSYYDASVDVGAFNADDDGFAVGGGIRTKIGPSFELDAALKWIDWDNAGSDTGVEVAGRYYFKKTLAVSFGTDMNDNADTFHVGFRAEF